MVRLGSIFRELRLATLAWVALMCARLGLSILGYKRISRHLPAPGRRAAPPAFKRRVRRRITLAARFVPGASCLPQALAGRILLAWRGYSSEIHLGVKAEPSGQIAAHAWLTSGEEIVLGDLGVDISEYSHLMVLDGADA